MSTDIQWTDETWNPVTGCTKVSPGCAHCYAEGVANRFWGKQYPDGVFDAEHGIDNRPREFTDVMTHADRLDQPLHWKKPRRIFVNSMSDLFHEDVPWSFIERVFDVMQEAKQHTFQVLTKRANNLMLFGQYWAFHHDGPLPNVWLGVSVENQHFADERIPLLLQTPAAVRFISAEPLLGPVSFRWAKWDTWNDAAGNRRPVVNEHDGLRMLDWVIIGGESGPQSRPFDVQWGRSIVEQCKAAGVPVFMKQLGANVTTSWQKNFPFRDRKGGDMSEWPDDLRIREFPR